MKSNIFLKAANIFTISVLLISCQILAQDEVVYNPANDINNRLRLPKSPEAEAFEKYGSTAVNLYSGTPDISLPLHTIKGRELDLPISLSYDASGIKVTQIATNVGLGWNLLYGGRISRISNGRPDDVGSGPLVNNFSILQYSNNSFESLSQLTDYLDFMDMVTGGTIDTELDFYSLNVIGINDYIVFDLETGIPRTLLNPRIQVTALPELSGWKVISEEGTEYHFGENNCREVTTVSGGSDAPGSSGVTFTGSSTSSWLLTKIVSKNKLDIFEFNYQPYNWQNNNFSVTTSSVTYKFRHQCPIGFYQSPSEGFNMDKPYAVQQLMPLSIKHNGEYLVKFTYKPREDLLFSANPYQGGNALDKILFYKYKAPIDDNTFESVDDNLFFKKIVFHHTYFGTLPAAQTQPHYFKRLKLDDFVIYQDNVAEGKTYAFSYNHPEQIPKITSNAQDYWGLYNGATGNASLIPATHYDNDYFAGGSRDYNFEKSIVGTLDKITYPTKGYSTFEYEQNELNDNRTIPDYHYIEDVPYFDFSPRFYVFEDVPATYWPGYVGIHPLMEQIYFTYFGLPDVNANYYVANEVRTTLLTIDHAQDYKIQTSGTGAYLIQKISGCDNPQVQNFSNCFYDDDENLYNFFPCLRPTNTVYITKNTGASFTSDPTNFVAGDFTWNTSPETPATVHMETGTYQVTLWAGEYDFGGNNDPEPVPSIKILKPTPMITPAHIDYRAKKCEGFRIRSIKEFSAIGQLAKERLYEYNLNFVQNNSSGVRIAEIPTALTLYNTKSIICVGNDYTGAAANTPTAVIRSPMVSTYPYIAYSSVFEIEKNGDETNGYTQSKFNVGNSGIVYSDYQITSFVPDFQNGKLAEINVFDKAKTLKKSEKYSYESKQFYYGFSLGYRKSRNNGYACWNGNGGIQYLDGQITPGQTQFPGAAPPPDWPNSMQWTDNNLGRYSYDFKSQHIYGRYGYLTSKETSIYDGGGGELREAETYIYDPIEPFLLVRKNKTTSDGFIQEEYTYDDINFYGNPEKIVDIAISSNHGELSRRHNIYTDYGDGGNFLTQVQASKGGNILEPRLHLDYNGEKSLATIRRDNGLAPEGRDYDSYIFGYGNRFPVAKIQGVAYSDIPSNLISAIRVASDAPINESNNTAMRLALDALRAAYPSALITTYTYDPVYGITSQTDPRGNATYFEYDELGRLKTVKDNSGFLLSENFYHYKN